MTLAELDVAIIEVYRRLNSRTGIDAAIAAANAQAGVASLRQLPAEYYPGLLTTIQAL
jgi:hypothetical protein